MNNKKEAVLKKNLVKLELTSVENILKLTEWTFDDLIELKNTYWEAYQSQVKANELLSASVIYKKYCIVDEAIVIKKNNGTEIWDLLS
jgi:hypothetical protein